MISKNSYLLSFTENNHPSFLLIPFRNEDIFNNSQINTKYNFNLVKMLQDRYPDKYVTLTSSGRHALKLVLEDIMNKIKYSEVSIKTTSDKKYISSCVTDMIEKLNLRWTRKHHNSHKVSLFNHEFGYVDESLNNRNHKNSFNIEDCAFSFDSKYNDNSLCGTKSQYAIFSLSKFFPIQIGGFLLSDTPIDNKLDDPKTIRYISNVVGYYFNMIDEWSESRLILKQYYIETFGNLNIKNYFEYNSNDVPGVFLFQVGENVNLPLLKKYFWKRGVQCSVFYGENAFFLPLNQFTTKRHIDYYYELYLNFLENNEA